MHTPAPYISPFATTAKRFITLPILAAGMFFSDPSEAATAWLPEIEIIGTSRSDERPSATGLVGNPVKTSGGVTLKDSLAVIPGGYPGNPVSGVFSIRGMPQDTFFPSIITGSNPFIAVLENGLPMSPATLRRLPPPLWNLQNAIALRGPQPFLPGPNAMAGALILDSLAPFPTKSMTGELWFEAASHDTLRGGLSHGWVLSPDRLFLKFSTFHEESDGYVTNLTTGDKKAGASQRDRNEIQLTWLPDPHSGAHVDFSLIHDEFRGNPTPLIQTTGGLDLFDHKQTINTQESFPTQRWASSIRASIPLDNGLQFESVTGVQRLDGSTVLDLDGTNLLTWSAEGFVDELRFTQFLGLGGERENLTWNLGAYYEDSKYSLGFTGIGGTPVPFGTPFTNSATEDVNIAALHGRFDWEFVPNLHLLSGLRVNREDREMKTSSVVGSIYQNSSADDHSDTALIPQSAIEWRPDEHHVIGARLSRTYRSGGVSHSPTLGIVQVFDKEEGWEAETYASVSRDTFHLKATAFYSEIEDMQVPFVPPRGFPNIDTLITNAARSHRYGIEVEGKWKPTPEFTLSSSLGWIHTRFDELQVDSTDHSGLSFPNAPEWTASLGGQYRHPSGVYASFLFSFADTTFSNAASPEATPLETRKLLSAHIGYQWDNAELYVFGTNLLDDEYALYRVQYSAFGGSVSGITGASRTIGVGCQFTW